MRRLYSARANRRVKVLKFERLPRFIYLEVQCDTTSAETGQPIGGITVLHR